MEKPNRRSDIRDGRTHTTYVHTCIHTYMYIHTYLVVRAVSMVFRSACTFLLNCASWLARRYGSRTRAATARPPAVKRPPAAQHPAWRGVSAFFHELWRRIDQVPVMSSMWPAIRAPADTAPAACTAATCTTEARRLSEILVNSFSGKACHHHDHVGVSKMNRLLGRELQGVRVTHPGRRSSSHHAPRPAAG